MKKIKYAAAMLTLVFACNSHAAFDRICSSTSYLMKAACRAESSDDLLVAKAKCFNEEERNEARECVNEVNVEYNEARELCSEQLQARLQVCDAIGEAPYDPEFEPDLFETSLTTPVNPNPYYPLSVGNTWSYSGDEEITVTVLNESKLIDDVRCFVINDVVSVDGQLVEDTDDWVALSKQNGAIWYCGEEAKDFEYFEGDSPSLPELVSIDGSFKVERDGDRAGILFPGSGAQVGDVFRQEFSLGNAEDVGEIVNLNYGYGDNLDLEEWIPEDLTKLLCDDDCIIVSEYTPLEPGVVEYKFYAPGIGFFLGINPEEDEVVYLTSCNVNPVCNALPELAKDLDEDEN